jgi:hypothetical protein
MHVSRLLTPRLRGWRQDKWDVRLELRLACIERSFAVHHLYLDILRSILNQDEIGHLNLCIQIDFI